ncbi:hypothetical protein PG994_004896 [Apiospora phragmitis]|uniref:Secreted protein n=1 Tax=Apiospora phragmitis TaxID=2905665 RepID=A0ABR1VS04_9PEZI
MGLSQSQHTGWRVLLAILLAAQASAKDVQINFWNSSDCSIQDPMTASKVIFMPRDNDDPTQGVTCHAPIGTQLFQGWLRDEHSDFVVAHVDTRRFDDNCQLVFYNTKPPLSQPQEEIDTGPCWQAYRRITKDSGCPSVTFQPTQLAMS